MFLYLALNLYFNNPLYQQNANILSVPSKCYIYFLHTFIKPEFWVHNHWKYNIDDAVQVYIYVKYSECQKIDCNNCSTSICSHFHFPGTKDDSLEIIVQGQVDGLWRQRFHWSYKIQKPNRLSLMNAQHLALDRPSWNNIIKFATGQSY